MVQTSSFTTGKTSSCGGPIAAGAKTAAIGRLLQRVLGLPLYMESIAAGQQPAAIVIAFAACYSGGPMTCRNILVSVAQAQIQRRVITHRNRPLHFPRLNLNFPPVFFFPVHFQRLFVFTQSPTNNSSGHCPAAKSQCHEF